MLTTLDTVRERLYDITARFFAGATVIWAEQTNTQANLPYVTIKLGGIRRRTHPVRDPDAGQCYHCDTVAEFNLYTQGRAIGTTRKATGNYVNTAASDLMEFANFMESPGVIDTLTNPPISVILKGEVRDLSFLENDRNNRYRAMAEFDVSYVMPADGWYGVFGIPAPNASGGGTEELVSEAIETIEEMEAEETA